jgi:hypothetical protein
MISKPVGIVKNSVEASRMTKPSIVEPQLARELEISNELDKKVSSRELSRRQFKCKLDLRRMLKSYSRIANPPRIEFTSTSVSYGTREMRLVEFTSRKLCQLLCSKDCEDILFFSSMIEYYCDSLKVNPICSVIATMLLTKAKEAGELVNHSNIVKLYIASLIVTVKFNEDRYWTNSHWTKHVHLSQLQKMFTSTQPCSPYLEDAVEQVADTLELNRLEVIILKRLDYRVMFTMKQVTEFIAQSIQRN